MVDFVFIGDKFRNFNDLACKKQLSLMAFLRCSYRLFMITLDNYAAIPCIILNSSLNFSFMRDVHSRFRNKAINS